jgi:hypothetical protein
MRTLNDRVVTSLLEQKGFDHTGKRLNNPPPTQVYLGRVENLPEPAGKVRTIAIADYWTQRVMSPVHKWMMNVLRYLPTDGTFNQDEALVSFVRRILITGEEVDSIDLKSATDLIPIELYRVLFKGIWPSHLVELWIALLTDRDFLVREDDDLVINSMRGRCVRYGRGQPMGTLSSWPSMALVHHALELYSATLAGYDASEFTDYRVLGDDNVTANSFVTHRYLEVTTALCVPTSRAKTLSGKLFIFASQAYLGSDNVSPLSLKEELRVKTYAQRLEMAVRAISRGWLAGGNTLPRFLRLMLSQKDYKSQVKCWARGVLGKVAQSAMVSAFGAFSRRLLDLLGIQGSGFTPFLNALAYKVEALAGDRGRHEKARRPDLRDLERSFALSIATTLMEQFRKELLRLELSSIRFGMWRDGIADTGCLPAAVYRRFESRRAGPELPGICLLPSGSSLPAVEIERKFKLRRGQFTEQLEVTRALDSSLWHVIEDSYEYLLGVATVDPSISDYDRMIVSEEEEWGGGMGGVSFDPSDPFGLGQGSPGALPPTATTVGGWRVGTPRLVTLVSEAKRTAQEVMDQLVRAESQDLGDPWDALTVLADLLVEVSKIPSFVSLNDWDAETPVADMLRDWVRRYMLYERVHRYLPWGENLFGEAPTESDYSHQPLTREETDHLLRDWAVDEVHTTTRVAPG